MTRQTWTAFVAAICFVALAVLMVVIPVPFVTWNPGGTQDTLGDVNGQPIITVDGTAQYPTTGQLDLTTVSVTRADSRVTLPEAVMAYWLPHRDALPRDAVYAPDKSAADVETEEAVMMETAQEDSIVAALRAAHRPVTQRPAVASVTVSGPAHNKLQPGDLVLLVDGVRVRAADQVGEKIRRRAVGDEITFVVLRAGKRETVKVTSVESTARPDTPAVGITVAAGYDYKPTISFDLGQQIGGPSAGLVFAVAIYDKITDGALLQGRHVAGTGTITPNGDVGPIGGIQEKIAAAESEGSTVFLVPAANCSNLAGAQTDMTLIKVATLASGIASLEELATPGGETRVPRC